MPQVCDELDAGRRQAIPTLRETALSTERSQASGLIGTLIAPERAGGALERLCDLILVSPALVDQAHHGMSFGHAIADCVVGVEDARRDNDTMALPRAEEASVVDERCAGGHLDAGKEVWLGGV